MQSLRSVEADYNVVAQYVATHSIKLLILDFNGVLDDYCVRKYDALRQLLDVEYEHHLAELLIAIEQAYIKDRSATIEQTCKSFFEVHNISITNEQHDMLDNFDVGSQLTERARVFLDSLDIPFVIYTSLSTPQLERALNGAHYDVFTRDMYNESKPSIKNLGTIMAVHDVKPQQTCVVGDGLIDDLMPAALLGMHTILITPYAEALVTTRG